MISAISCAERAGVLTQPSWLVAQSGNFDNDPVRRGKWILEHLLGGTVPDLPISVCAVVPEDEEKTLRQRFAVIRDDAYCWKCHRQMNPLGMPFESYDHFGRFRLRENYEPVVTSGRKLRAHTARELLRDSVRLMFGGKRSLQTREHAGLWYEPRKEDPFAERDSAER